MAISSKQYCERMVKQYVEQIDSQKKEIKKNFEDMDLENARIRNKIEEIVQEMCDKCEELKTKIKEDYKFI